jgi:hypothetical protein
LIIIVLIIHCLVVIILRLHLPLVHFFQFILKVLYYLEQFIDNIVLITDDSCYIDLFRRSLIAIAFVVLLMRALVAWSIVSLSRCNIRVAH